MRSEIYQFDNFLVNAGLRAVFRGDERVALTPKVFDLLMIFVASPGEVLEKRELMDRLWPNTFVEESNLTQNVAVLRKALGDDSKPNRVIATIPGRGYQFVADVRKIEKKEEEPVVAQGVETSRPSVFWFVSVGVVLVLAAVGFLYLFMAGAEAPVVVRPVQVTTWSGLDLFPSISPDGNSVVFSSDRTGRFEIFSKQFVQGAAEVQLTSDGGQNFQAEYSPDGSQIAYHSRERRGIWVIPSTGGTPRRLTEFGSNPAWSPDGREIAFQSVELVDVSADTRNALAPSTIWRVPAQGGTPEQVTQTGQPAGGHGSPDWAPDGKRIAFDVNDWASSEIWTVDLKTGNCQQIFEKNLAPESLTAARSEPVYDPRGGAVYFATDVGLSIEWVRLNADGRATGEPEKIHDTTGSRARYVSLSREGRRIAFSSLSISSNIWSSPIGNGGNAAAPAPAQLTANASTRSSSPAFSPDGSRLAFIIFNPGTPPHVWTMNIDGSDLKQLPDSVGHSPWWIADGNRIVFTRISNDSTELWSAAADGSSTRPVASFGARNRFYSRISPDGSSAVFNSTQDGTINMWMLNTTGGDPVQLTFDEELAGFPAWSPDGKWIAFQIKRGTDTHVALIGKDGGAVTQLTSEPGQSWVYDWAPDNDEILFAGQRAGIWNIYAVSRSTRKIRKLTDFDSIRSYVRYPAWSPRNDRIAYEYAETRGNVWMSDLK